MLLILGKVLINPKYNENSNINKISYLLIALTIIAKPNVYIIC